MVTRVFGRRREATLSLEGGVGRIAAIADTHARPHPALAARLAEQRPAAILHAGDIGDPGVLAELAEHAPVYAVRGNIDERAGDLPDELVIDAGERLRIFMTHIGVIGPRLRADVAARARAARASLVVCGHSHVPFIGEDRGLAVFNPGSVGPRRFHLPIVLGIIEVTASGIRLAHVDCETGKRWMPP